MTDVRRTPDDRFTDLPDWPYEPHYTDAPFPDVPSKAGALAFPRLVPVRAALDAWDGPVCVAFAAGDPTFPPRVGEAWAARLRRADPFVLVADAGQFVQEQQPAAVAAAILGHVGRHPL